MHGECGVFSGATQYGTMLPEVGATMLNNIVDNIEQCGQQNIFNSVSSKLQS